EGQKTGAFEIVDALGDAPDIHALPVGNAGNITAYWKGFREYAGQGEPGHAGEGLPAVATRVPQMWGFQAAGAAPIVAGHPITEPETVATAIRIGNPASWELAEAARDDSGGVIEAVTDEQILAAHRVLSSEVGVFVEPASAAGVAPPRGPSRRASPRTAVPSPRRSGAADAARRGPRRGARPRDEREPRPRVRRARPRARAPRRPRRARARERRGRRRGRGRGR